MSKQKQSEWVQVKADTTVQIPLLEEHAEQIESKVVEVGNAILDLSELLKQGYSLTFSYDPDREQFSARLAGITKGMAHNQGMLLYANGDSFELAICCLWVKHFLVSKGTTWIGQSQLKRKFS